MATAQVHQGDALVIDHHLGEQGLVFLEIQKSDLQVQRFFGTATIAPRPDHVTSWASEMGIGRDASSFHDILVNHRERSKVGSIV